MASKKQAIQLLQAMLNVSSRSAPLILDGVVGSRTSTVFKSLPPEQVNSISVSLSQFGIDVSALISTIGDGWISRSQLFQIAQQVSSLTDVPIVTLESLVSVEAESQVSDGEIHFNAKSLGPGGRGVFRGLTQIGASAWRDAEVEGQRLGVKLPSYASALDPVANLLAAALYLRSNLSRSKLPLTAAFPIAYGFHNQGPGFLAIAQGKRDFVALESQSSTAKRLLKEGVALLS